jgi:hypothetical protein
VARADFDLDNHLNGGPFGKGGRTGGFCPAQFGREIAQSFLPRTNPVHGGLRLWKLTDSAGHSLGGNVCARRISPVLHWTTGIANIDFRHESAN